MPPCVATPATTSLGVAGIGEKSAALLVSLMDSMTAVWADIDHDGGANLVAAVDSYCQEQGLRRAGAGLLRRLSAPGARQQLEFNVSIMTGRTDLDLGITPDVPGSRGLLPLEPPTVERVVGYLGVESTTRQAVRVLAGRQLRTLTAGSGPRRPLLPPRFPTPANLPGKRLCPRVR